MKTPSVRSFALIGALEAIVRGVPLSVYPLALYRAWQDAVVVSQIYLAVGLVSLITVLIVPGLNRRIPRRWLHSFAVLLYLAAATLGMLGGKLTGFALLCASSATAMAFVCFNTNVLDYMPRSEYGRLETMRLFHAGLGWAAGPFVGVWLYRQWAPAPFIIVAAAALAMGVTIWWAGMGNTSRHQPMGSVSPNPLRYLRRFAAQPRLVAGWLLAVLRACGWSVFLVYTGIFAIQKGLGEQVGGLTASLASMGLFATPLMLRWVQARSLRRAVRLGFLRAGLCFAAALLVSDWPWASVLLLLIGAWHLVLLDVCAGLPFLVSVKPSERGEMSAVYSSFRDAAAILTPAMVWLVLKLGPVTAVFGVACAVLMLGWWIAGHMHPELGMPGAQRQRRQSS